MLNIHDLSGKTILLTGASGGIGQQTAITISQAGGTLILTGRNHQKLETTLAKLDGVGHQIIIADLTAEEDIKLLAANCPPVDGVVHGAGIVEVFPTRFINKQKIDTTFSINFYAPVLIMTALFRHKKINKNSSIVFISSLSSSRPYNSSSLYAASKSALETYCKALAGENKDIGLRANSISPGVIKTDMYEQMKQLHSAEAVENHEKYYLLGYGEPIDVANFILFLLSNASKWMTGQTIVLDGGYLLGL